MGRTNDPLEFKDIRFALIGSGLPDNRIDSKYLQTDLEINRLMKEQTRIACFTADSDEIESARIDILRRGFARSRMWSQYAEGHFGVCLVFSKKELRQRISALKENVEDRLFEGSVDYKDFSREAINARTFNGDKLEKTSITEFIAGHLDEHYTALFLEKAQDYRDENEYRFVFFNSVPGFVYVPIDDCLKAVIVGVRFPEVYRDLIIEQSYRLHAEYRSLQWHNGRPYLSDR